MFALVPPKNNNTNIPPENTLGRDVFALTNK
jgi:hypothetical protein